MTYSEIPLYFGRYPGRTPPDTGRIGIGDVMEELERQTSGELKLSDFVSRKRYDAVCAFSSLYYLDEQNRLRALTRESREQTAAPVSAHTNFPERTNRFTNRHWRMPEEKAGKRLKKGTDMQKLIRRMKEYTLSVTGMGFQDAWNLDLGRVKGCCVHVATADGSLTPLCLFHVTNAKGRRLYHTGSQGELCSETVSGRDDG